MGDTKAERGQAGRADAATLVVTGRKVLTPTGVLHDASVWARDGKIVAVGAGVGGPAALGQPVGQGQPTAPIRHLAAEWVLPGFIDLHMHGGAGHDVTAVAAGQLGAAQLAEILRFHGSHGTTACLLSVGALPPAQMPAAVERLVEAVARLADTVADTVADTGAGSGAGHTTGIGALSEVLGLHLEGPYLNPQYRGALPAAALRPPDLDEMRRLLAAGRGLVKMVTLAPELLGAADLTRLLRDAGVVVAAGHSDATYAQTLEAHRLGLTHVTHTFSAMRLFHHREPGLVGAALTINGPAGLTAEIIADGIHSHPAAIDLLFRAKGVEGVCLITDSMAAAGCADGTYTLLGQEVVVKDGRARLPVDGRLAGSTLTMDAAVRKAAKFTGLGLDGAATAAAAVPTAMAAVAAAATPARVLGVSNRKGSIAAGMDADLALADAYGRLVGVLAKGRPIRGGQ